jgi:O-antigen ligase
MLLPGALVLYLAFNAGGFFAGATGDAAVAVALVLVLRTTLAAEPFAGLSGPVAAAAGALALYAVWTLLSASWSEAPARALLEFDRALLYLLVVVLFGSVRRDTTGLVWLVRGLALAFLAVSVCALLTRVLPDLWHTAPNIANERLSYPLTYWNALGLLAALGIVLCLHLTSTATERAGVCVAAAAAVPISAATLLFTFSRGAIAACAIGLVAYAFVARPRYLFSGLIAAAPAAAIAVQAAYRADLLATERPTTAAAIDQGHEVALVVALCGVGAAAVRAVLLRADRRIAGWGGRRIGRPLRVATAAVAALGILVSVVALDVPDRLAREYDRFVEGATVRQTGDLRERLTDPGNNGRLDAWDVAIDAFSKDQVHGEGAGTYTLLWAKDRPYPSVVRDAHSLYVEVGGELGTVGLALLLLVVIALIATPLVRARGPARALYGALFAAALAWALHAGIDWDWEMPAVTLWVFATGGAALASSRRASGPLTRAPPRLARVLISLCWLFLAITPALVAISQKRLNESVKALKSGDCSKAIDDALGSLGAVGARPEPFEVIGYCDARLRRPHLAERAMEAAIDRDPGNWELHYGLALVRGAAGRDPRLAARRALRLNPKEDLAREAVRRFRTRSPGLWQRRAYSAPLPL